MVRKRILIAASDSAFATRLRELLSPSGYEIATAASAEASLEAAASGAADIAIIVSSTPGDALGPLTRLLSIAPELPIVIVAPSTDAGARALQAGAHHFVLPADIAILPLLVQRAIDHGRLRRTRSAQRRRESRSVLRPFLGRSDAIQRAEEEARLAQQTDRPILIEGESGTGKGVLAAWLHRHSPRAEEPYIEGICATVPPERFEAELFGRPTPGGETETRIGLLEMAQHGTLFLDEIDQLTDASQRELLRAIEEKRYRRRGESRDRDSDVRLIAATRRDLTTLVRQKRFREDLLYRIQVLSVRMPPLRERVEDLRILAEDRLARIAAETGSPRLELSNAAIATLEAHDWPGNLRELRHVVQIAALRCEGDTIEPRHLRLSPGGTPDASGEGDLTLADVERLHIERALKREAGHVERAARRLGIPRSTLYQKLKTMGIRPQR